MSKVVLEGYIVVPDNDVSAVTAELPTHIELARKESDCLRFEVTQNQRIRVFLMCTRNSLIGVHLKHINCGSVARSGEMLLRMWKGITA